MVPVFAEGVKEEISSMNPLTKYNNASQKADNLTALLRIWQPSKKWIENWAHREGKDKRFVTLKTDIVFKKTKRFLSFFSFIACGHYERIPIFLLEYFFTQIFPLLPSMHALRILCIKTTTQK